MKNHDDLIKATDMTNIKPPMYDLRVYCEDEIKFENKRWGGKITGKKIYFKIFQPESGLQSYDIYCYNCDKEYKLKSYSPKAFRDYLLLQIIFYLLILYGYKMIQDEIWGSIRDLLYYGLLFMFTISYIQIVLRGFAIANKEHSTKIVRKYKEREYEEYLGYHPKYSH